MLVKRIKNHFERKNHFEDFLRKKGIVIGHNTFISNEYCKIDLFSPFLINIGSNCIISSGCTILTHDCGRSVAARYAGVIIGGGGPVSIGDNVYIGMNVTILRNSSIGSNVIIGANSLIHGYIESNCVYAGVPARKICTIDEYIKKNLDRQHDEARQIAVAYFNRFHTLPPESIFNKFDYYMLWSDVFEHKERLTTFITTRNCDKVFQCPLNKKRFDSYKDFIDEVFK